MKAPEGNVPEGFNRHFRSSKFTEPWEPLFSKVEEDQVKIGVVLRDVHCNSRGLVHGAFLAALADNAIGLSCGVVLKNLGREASGLVTVNLSMDYVGRAKVGDWIETDIDVVKAGRSLCFANCLISNSTGPIARANATFQIPQS